MVVVLRVYISKTDSNEPTGIRDRFGQNADATAAPVDAAAAAIFTTERQLLHVYFSVFPCAQCSLKDQDPHRISCNDVEPIRS